MLSRKEYFSPVAQFGFLALLAGLACCPLQAQSDSRWRSLSARLPARLPRLSIPRSTRTLMPRSAPDIRTSPDRRFQLPHRRR